MVTYRYGGGMNVGIYARLSRDPDGTATATARQEADCRALCDREGWEVIGVYVDSDLSGYDPTVERPAFMQMVDDLTSGKIAAVVVWKLDRLSRQPGQFEAVVSACERVGARIVSINESTDMTSPAGLAMMRVGMAFAAMESQTISLRVKRAILEEAQEGKPHRGGFRPFGLNQSRTEVVDDEAAAIRSAAAQVLDGVSLTQVARGLNERGVRTSRGNEWTVSGVRNMLVSPHIAGRRMYHDEVIKSDVIPAIVDADQWERLVAILKDPARRAGGGRVIRPLSGVVRCGLCGSVLRARYTRNRSTAALYRCVKQPGVRGCGGITAAAVPLEQMVFGAVTEAIDTGALGALIARRDDGEVSRLQDERVALRVRREALITDYHVDGLISRREFMSAMGAISDKVDAIEDDIARRSGADALAVLPDGATIHEMLSDTGSDAARTIIRAIIDRVVVGPGARGANRFDPSRVTILWREQ